MDGGFQGAVVVIVVGYLVDLVLNYTLSAAAADTLSVVLRDVV